MCVSAHFKHSYLIHYKQLKDSSSDNAKYFKDRLEVISNFINLLSIEWNCLEHDQNKITECFKEWHVYLMELEHKIKKPITENQERIEENRKSIIKELEELVKIINICQGGKDRGQSFPDNSHLGHEDVDDEEEESYSLDTKILLEETEIKNKSQLLNDNINIENNKIATENNNELDITLLNRIDNYLDKYTSRGNNNNNMVNQYHTPELKIIDYDLIFSNSTNQQIKKLLDELVSLNKKETKVLNIGHSRKMIQSYHGDIPMQQKQLSSGEQFTSDNHKDERFVQKGISQVSLGGIKENILISSSVGCQQMNIQAQSIEPLNYSILNKCSMFTVGEFVYIFSNSDFVNSKKYYIFNPKKNLIEFREASKDIDYDYLLSACYDGQDHIYLIYVKRSSLYFLNSKRIDCLNIKSKTFQQIDTYPSDNLLILSFFYDNKIYTLGKIENTIMIEYDLTLKVFKNVEITTERFRVSCLGACTDGNGNIYVVLTDSKFFKFEINGKKIVNLNSPKFDKSLNLQQETYPMLYHNAESNMNYIYLMGGKNGNYCFSVNNNEWCEFFENDHYERNQCGACIIQKN